MSCPCCTGSSTQQIAAGAPQPLRLPTNSPPPPPPPPPPPAAPPSIGGRPQLEPPHISCASCRGRYCSIMGSTRTCCILNEVPIDSVSTEEKLRSIALTCPFATRATNPIDLPVNQKRNVLYWWYATHTFHVCGWGNREPLPSCVVTAIRTRFPNPRHQTTGQLLEEYDVKESLILSCNK